MLQIYIKTRLSNSLNNFLNFFLKAIIFLIYNNNDILYLYMNKKCLKKFIIKNLSLLLLIKEFLDKKDKTGILFY